MPRSTRSDAAPCSPSSRLCAALHRDAGGFTDVEHAHRFARALGGTRLGGSNLGAFTWAPSRLLSRPRRCRRLRSASHRKIAALDGWLHAERDDGARPDQATAKTSAVYANRGVQLLTRGVLGAHSGHKTTRNGAQRWQLLSVVRAGQDGSHPSQQVRRLPLSDVVVEPEQAPRSGVSVGCPGMCPLTCTHHVSVGGRRWWFGTSCGQSGLTARQ